LRGLLPVRNIDQMSAVKIITGACLFLAIIIAVIGFAVLADLTQFVVEVPRQVTMFVHGIRMELFWTGVLAMAVAYVLGRKNRVFSNRFLNWSLAAFLVMALSGYINPPYVMFPTQQNDARFITIEQLGKIPSVDIGNDDEVFVWISTAMRAHFHWTGWRNPTWPAARSAVKRWL